MLWKMDCSPFLIMPVARSLALLSIYLVCFNLIRIYIISLLSINLLIKLGYEVKLPSGQNKELVFELICPGRKSYQVGFQYGPSHWAP